MTNEESGSATPPDLLAQVPDQLPEIKARAERRAEEEEHEPIDVHPAREDGSLDASEILTRLCTECSDDDTIGALEFGDTIDAGDGVPWPCPASDVDWLVAEVERLCGELEDTRYDLARRTEDCSRVREALVPILRKHPMSDEGITRKDARAGYVAKVAADVLRYQEAEIERLYGELAKAHNTVSHLQHYVGD